MPIRLVELSAANAKAITQFDSHGAASIDLAHGRGAAHAYVIHFTAGGAIGPHPAGFDQIFIAIQGSGWIAGSDGVRHAIGQNVAAIIPCGELHSKGSDIGLVALMLQSDRFDIPV